MAAATDMTTQVSHLKTVLGRAADHVEVTWSANRGWRLAAQLGGGRNPSHIGEHIDDLLLMLFENGWIAKRHMEVHALRPADKGWTIQIYADIQAIPARTE